MTLRILLIIVVVIAVLLAFAATKPNTLRVQRSAIIQAPPEKIFALINDLHNWPRWQLEDKQDSSVKRTYRGSESGVGAVCEWEGSGSTGKGRMSITESVPPSRIAVEVDFVKPFASHNVNQFVLEPVGTSTKITWSWNGQNLYFMKLMGVFVNMDKMMGKHFESGLASLKSLAEK